MKEIKLACMRARCSKLLSRHRRVWGPVVTLWSPELTQHNKCSKLGLNTSTPCVPQVAMFPDGTNAQHDAAA